MSIRMYECLNCGAELKFDPISQAFKCEFCEQSFSENELNIDPTKVEEPKVELETEETGEFITYKCEYCGAEVISTQEEAATFCLYCHRPVILSRSLSGEFKPEFIIPFKHPKEKAIEEFKKNYNKKIFVPDAYKSLDNIEKIRGLYVPFWLFDCEANFKVEGDGEISKTTRSGDYRITDINVYRCIREGVATVTGVPIDASIKMNNDIMNSIEPFNYESLIKFSDAYLSGFFAQRYDEDKETCLPLAEERIVSTVFEKAKENMSDYSLKNVSKNIETFNMNSRYALLPVWMLYTKFEDKDYLFAMNGQTGKLIGELPVDEKKCKQYFWKLALKVALACSSLSLVINILGGL